MRISQETKQKVTNSKKHFAAFQGVTLVTFSCLSMPYLCFLLGVTSIDPYRSTPLRSNELNQDHDMEDEPSPPKSNHREESNPYKATML